MFEDAVAVLRSWLGEPATVVLEPEGTVMDGVLSELDGGGPESAMFAVDAEHTSGVAIALFRDAIGAVDTPREGELVIHQGRMTVRVTCGGRRSGPA